MFMTNSEKSALEQFVIFLWDLQSHTPMISQATCTGNLPAKRAFALHACIAVQHAETAALIAEGEVTIPENAWDSPGPDADLLRQFISQVSPEATVSSEALLKLGGSPLDPL